ncbi:MAG TPA: PAS domain S-box protein [Kofleriaceae bacterium]|nr:PAS domain S-box protein [Kofleriaceae bacterium]
MGIRLIAELSRDVIARIDATGQIAFISPSARRALGFEPTELVGTPALDLIHPEDRDMHRDAFCELLASGTSELPAIVVRACRNDGGCVHLETVCHAVRDPSGTLVELQVAGRDVTERVEAEIALQASKASLRAVLEALLEPCVVHDRGQILTANRAFLDLLGWDSVEALKKLRAIELVHPEDREVVAALIKGSLRNRRTPEHRLLHRSGEAIPVEVTGAPYPFDGTIAALAIVHDLRERKRLDAELAAAERMASLGRLASAVGHEINNPLTYVLGMIDVLRRDLAGLATNTPAAAPLIERAEYAREGALRVRDIVRDLKALSPANEGPPGAIDLHRVLDLAAGTAAHEINHRARLICDYGSIAPVSGSEGRLIQVFVNLLVNAAQAIPEGDVASNDIRVVTRMADTSRVMVEVFDTGRGFGTDEAPRLFEPYFTTKAGTGIGLGLSIAHRIVSSFGGTIVAEARSPRGAVFRVTLPVHPGVPETRALETGSPVMAQPAARVLFADDEILIRNLAQPALEPFAVTVVASGREVIELLARGERFDAIICDLHMPDVGGVDVFEWIVAHKPELADRFAFMTGGAFTERARHFVTTSRLPHLDKPFELEKLRELIGSMVER